LDASALQAHCGSHWTGLPSLTTVISIGVLRPEHASTAVALWHEAGLTRPWNDSERDLALAMRGPASTVLTAVTDGGELVGTAMVGHDGHRGWVYYLAVTPALTSTGVGRALMDACEQWVRDAGIPKIQLMVRSTNLATVDFYQHLGYTQDDVTVLSRRLDT
jgi:ribosomal protein S18 acetylase RimI-like enzyme